MWHKGVRWYHVKSDILKEGPGTKYPLGWEIAKCKIPSVKMLFKSNTNGHKHPNINLCYVYRRISISMRTLYMMASPKGNIFRVTVFLWRESTWRSPVDSPHKGQWCGALIFPLNFAWTNSWANNLETGDLRRHRAHYDVTVMRLLNLLSTMLSTMCLVIVTSGVSI